MNIREKFARQCSITGEGMNSGWVYEDGNYYYKNKSDAITKLREHYTDTELPDDELMELAIEDEVMYWTVWDEDDYQFQSIGGELLDLESDLSTRAVNVIQIVSGVIHDVTTFLINHKNNEKEKVDAAERFFCNTINDRYPMQYNYFDLQDFIEDGSFDCKDGFNITITWSNKVYE